MHITLSSECFTHFNEYMHLCSIHAITLLVIQSILFPLKKALTLVPPHENEAKQELIIIYLPPEQKGWLLV